MSTSSPGTAAIWTADRIDRAAQTLIEQHHRGQRFEGLREPIPDSATAYAIQHAYVSHRCRAAGTCVAGYKIALTTPAMRTLVGYADSISGQLLAKHVHADGAVIQARAHGRLAVEFEIAFVMTQDLPERTQGWGREIAQWVRHAHPALELVDDRNADYAALPAQILTLVADNAWNAGLVLGPALKDQTLEALDDIEGRALIDGCEIGRGHGRDVLGHPLDALAWLAEHLQSRGLRLRAGDIVTTGSLVKTAFPTAPCEVALELQGQVAVRARLV